MKKSELLNRVEHKPHLMGCCTECSKIPLNQRDCEPNPLKCVDFCIANHEVLTRIKEEGELN